MGDDAEVRRLKRIGGLGNTLLGLSVTYLLSVGLWKYISKNKIIWYQHDVRGVPKEDVMWSLSYFRYPYRHLVYVETDKKRYPGQMAVVYHSEEVWGNNLSTQLRVKSLRYAREAKSDQ